MNSRRRPIKYIQAHTYTQARTFHDQLERLGRPQLLEDGHGRHRVRRGEDGAEQERGLMGD